VKQLKALCLTILLTSTISLTHAQIPGLPNIPGDPGGACEAIGGGGICDWIDFAMSLSDQLTDMFETFNQEITAMGEDLFADATEWLKDSLSDLTQGIPGPEGFEQAFGSLQESIKNGPSQFREDVQRGIRSLTEKQLTTLYDAPNDSSDGHYNQFVKTFPVAAAAEVVTARQKERSSLLKAESAAAAETSFKTGAVVQQNTAAQDTAQAILGAGGDADTLEDDVNTAVSSRAAIQALTEGLADTLRHDASFQANLSSVVKALSQQQVMTNWQLQLLVKGLTEQNEQDLAAAQAQLQGHVTEVFQQADAISAQFQTSITQGVEILEPYTARLNPGDLGW
jgi:hypothetical protein